MTTSPAACRCLSRVRRTTSPAAGPAAYVTSRLRRHASPYRVQPHRPVVLDGKPLDEIEAPARVAIPPLMRGYLRLGTRVCGEPAHDPDFGVADFMILLDKRQADIRYLNRLRSVAAATEMAEGICQLTHAWLPQSPCDESCYSLKPVGRCGVSSGSGVRRTAAC